MTRIIAGVLGGRTLVVPSRGTRPTSDRVREAVFSHLEAAGALTGAKALDLFAGSGALGLEAVSRGAASAVLVDSAPQAIATCRANIAKLDLAARVQAVRETAERFAARPPVAGRSDFGLVFLDPPYGFPTDALSVLCAALAEHGHLPPGGLIILERATRDGPPAWPAAWGPVVPESKKYGDTALWYVRRPA